MDVYEAIVRRRTVRRFKDVAVPYDVLTKCVDAARLAPAARNGQVCEFMIVDDEHLLPKVFGAVGSWAGQPRPSGAPPGHRPRAYVLILINTTRLPEAGISSKAAMYDAGMAAENVILTALEEGLGTCAILSQVESEMKPALNIPAKYDIGMVVAMGYPDESPLVEVAKTDTKYWVDDRGVRHVPKRKLEDVLHRNKF